MRIVILKIDKCKKCPYFKGDAYASHYHDGQEVYNGICTHPTQIDMFRKQPRAIHPQYTKIVNNFPDWCELDEPYVKEG